jgi:hypothetical protein
MKRKIALATWLTLCLPVTTILVAGGCTSSEAAQWKMFSSQNCRFEVLMPGVPKETSSFTDTAVGRLNDHSFMLKARQGNYKAAYSISYVAYPSAQLKVSPQQFMEQTWEASNDFAGSTQIYKKHISLKGHAGLEYQIKAKSGSLITGRNYLIDNRLYQLTAIMSQEQFQRGDAMKFLDSFQPLP